MNYSHPIIAERDPFIELRDTLCDNESIIDSLRYLILEEGYGRAEIAREFKGEGKLNPYARGQLQEIGKRRRSHTANSDTPRITVAILCPHVDAPAPPP